MNPFKKSPEKISQETDINPAAEEKALDKLGFDKLFKELNNLKKEKYLSDEEVNDLLNDIQNVLKRETDEDDEELENAEEKKFELFKRIMQRLLTETKIAEYYQDTIGLSNLLLKPEEWEFKVPVERAKGNIEAVAHIDAAYIPKDDKILINSEVLDFEPLKMIRDLSLRGDNRQYEALKHELLHVKQFAISERLKKERIKIISEMCFYCTVACSFLWVFGKDLAALPIFIVSTLNYFSSWLNAKDIKIKTFDRQIGGEEKQKNKSILNETQSYLSGTSLFENGKISVSALMTKLNSETYELGKTAKEMDKILTANTAIKRLYAMGFKPIEVAKVISDSNWDDSKNKWLPLEGLVEKKMKRRKITAEVADTMVDVWNMHKEIERLKVMKIVQDELKEIHKELTDVDFDVSVNEDGSVDIKK